MEQKEERIYLDAFKPRSYQLPIVDAIENKGYKRVLAIMPRRCLSGRTFITLSDGSYKFLRDINVGDSILSWNGSTFVTDKVKNIWKTEPKMTCRIGSPNCPSVISSLDHSFAKFDSRSFSSEFVPVSELKDTDRLLLYGGMGLFGGEVLDSLEAEMYGYLMSSICRSMPNRISFSHHERVILERIADVFEQYFDVPMAWRESCGLFTIFYAISSKCNKVVFNKVRKIWKFRDEYAGSYVPVSVWSFDHTTITKIMNALLVASGTIVMEKEVEIRLSVSNTTDEVWKLYFLLRKMGYVPISPLPVLKSEEEILITSPCDILSLINAGVWHGKELLQEKIKKILAPLSDTKRSLWCGCYRNTFITSPAYLDVLFDIETECNGNFLANGYLVHNSGKDITAFNLAIRQCLRKSCVVFYIFPTYSQAKKVIWDSITNEGKRILDFIPKSLVESMNSQEMKIRFVNDSLLQLIGSDNIDRIVGTNPYACIFSEYALQDPRAYQFIKPILTANNGWALFISTPRGRNSLWDLYQIAQQSPLWFCYRQTVEDTKHITLEEIEQERNEGIMSEDLIQQEYYCSFSQGIEGAYYLKYFDRLRLSGQIGKVPWIPDYKVHTAWDLGVRDSTAILFYQTVGRSIHIIDAYENTKEGLEHYIKVLQGKPYIYGKHFAPHDIRVREFTSGITRFDKARQLGITFTVAPNISIMDGIELVRTTLPRCWIDEQNCANAIRALENYRQEFDKKRKIYLDHPLHDWSSHWADCMRYLALTLPKTRDGMTPEDVDKIYKEALYGGQHSLPPIFRNH